MPVSITQAFRLAVNEAKRGLGNVSPNPPVGCAILDAEGELIGLGYHKKFGQAHAEVEAHKAVIEKGRLRGATVIVTLEPCAHYGKTPPCAEFLASLPIDRVVYGLSDPNPKVNGGGEAILRKNGKTVQTLDSCPEISMIDRDQLRVELEELTEQFLLRHRLGRPFYSLKVATSLDGKVALDSGESKWITGELARAETHQLRHFYDAVLVGAGTVLQDDPKLNIRLKLDTIENHLIILDPKNQLSAKSLNEIREFNFYKVRDPKKVIHITSHPMSGFGFDNLVCNCGEDGFFDLRQISAPLLERNLQGVFIEGGAATYGEFLRQKLVDRVYHFQAPIIMGRGMGWSELFAIEKLADSPRLKWIKKMNFGDDTLTTGRIF